MRIHTRLILPAIFAIALFSLPGRVMAQEQEFNVVGVGSDGDWIAVVDFEGETGHYERDADGNAIYVVDLNENATIGASFLASVNAFLGSLWSLFDPS
jgi:hypothetical protein